MRSWRSFVFVGRRRAAGPRPSLRGRRAAANALRSWLHAACCAAAGEIAPGCKKTNPLLYKTETDFGNLQNIILSRIFVQNGRRRFYRWPSSFLSLSLSIAKKKEKISFCPYFFENIEYQRVNFEIPKNVHQNRREKRCF